MTYITETMDSTTGKVKFRVTESGVDSQPNAWRIINEEINPVSGIIKKTEVETIYPYGEHHLNTIMNLDDKKYNTMKVFTEDGKLLNDIKRVDNSITGEWQK